MIRTFVTSKLSNISSFNAANTILFNRLFWLETKQAADSGSPPHLQLIYSNSYPIVRLNLGGEAPSLILDAIVIFHLHIKRNIGFFLRVFGCCSRGTQSQFLW